VVHHSAALARVGGGEALREAVVSERFEDLPTRLSALCSYALKLTRAPSTMSREDLERLRAHGLTDRDIVDANQVVAYFNYVNRIADGLGVELEGYWPEQLRRLRD
jgi:uncharacterized peroxidase-related enzyme